MDKNYEISLYGAVNAIVSVFASTVGSMACVHLEVWGLGGTQAGSPRTISAKGVVVRLKPVEAVLKRESQASNTHVC